MKIAFVIPNITRTPGFENNVSAHVQLPCEIASRLIEEGHQVDILTDSLVEGFTLPVCIPAKVNVVPMIGRAFFGTSTYLAPFLKPISFLFRFLLMAFRIRKTVVQGQYDLVHFYGTERILILSKLVWLLRIRVPMAMTFNQCIQSSRYDKIRKSSICWNHLRAVVVSMEQMKKGIPSNINVSVIRHGIVKNLSDALELVEQGMPAQRVLFWRRPDLVNGGDICIEVFRKLAPLYPHIDFDLAIRAESTVADLDAYERDIENGHVFRFPYSEGVTLESLLAGSICVFQPFREYSYYPQFVILESLVLGIPVVASELPGVEEMVDVGETGYVFPIDKPELAEEGIKKILDGKVLDASSIRDEVNNIWTWEGCVDRVLELYRSMV